MILFILQQQKLLLLFASLGFAPPPPNMNQLCGGGGGGSKPLQRRPTTALIFLFLIFRFVVAPLAVTAPRSLWSRDRCRANIVTHSFIILRFVLPPTGFQLLALGHKITSHGTLVSAARPLPPPRAPRPHMPSAGIGMRMKPVGISHLGPSITF